MASGNKESELPPMAAQDILNQMGCEGKKAGEKIKDRVDGETVTVRPKSNNLILASKSNYKRIGR